MVTVLIFSRLTYQKQSTPKERCELAGGGSVCIDCFRRGTCEANGDGTFEIKFDYACPKTPSQFYCDDTLNFPEFFGTCSPLPASATKCTCSSDTNCITDPNNSDVVLHCETSSPLTDPPCSGGKRVDLTTCSCSFCSKACPLLDDPDDECERFFFCSGTKLIPSQCRKNYCFDQTSCTCVEKENASLSPVLTEISEVTVKCHAACPFINFPDDDCREFYLCDPDSEATYQCPENTCFDQAACQL